MSEMATPEARRYLVVGSAIADFLVSVDRLPAAGETVLAKTLTCALGGKGANQATALRRLGNRVAILTAVGADAAGAAFRELFAAEGIEAAFVHTAASPTGVAFPMVLPGGQNAIVAAPSASLALPVAAVTAARRELASATALLLQLEIPFPVARAAMLAARELAVPVFLNPAPAVGEARELLRLADVVIPNQLEAEALSGLAVTTPAEALAAARALRSQGPQAAVITLGEDGAVVSAPGTDLHFPAYRVQAIDTTGAGDAFCAGLADARGRGLAWGAAVDFACACGALACRGQGAIPWLPTAAEAHALVVNPARRC
jgi:ribokinase